MISNIPIDSSEYAIEDLIKDFEQEPIFRKYIENKDERKCIVEFDSLATMEKFVQKYNQFELKPETKLVVEIIEVPTKKSRSNRFNSRHTRPTHHRNPGRNSLGSHYKQQKNVPARKTKPTVEDLDKELEAYMNQDNTKTT